MKILYLASAPTSADSVRRALKDGGTDFILTIVPSPGALPGILAGTDADVMLVDPGFSEEARRDAFDLVRRQKPLLPLILLSADPGVTLMSETTAPWTFRTGLPGLPLALHCAVTNSRSHRQPEASRPDYEGLVFVVDDNSDIRESIHTGLRSHGYRTLPLRDGAEAVAQYASRIKEVALVITDLDMPRLGGQALAKALRRLNPGLKVLFISGTGTDERLETAADQPGTEFLPKPFRMKELLAKVEALLHSPGLLHHHAEHSPHYPQG